jgi:hypothetical protein
VAPPDQSVPGDLAGADRTSSLSDGSSTDGFSATPDLAFPMLTQTVEMSGTTNDLYAVTGSNGTVVVCGDVGAVLVKQGANNMWMSVSTGNTNTLRTVTAWNGTFWIGGKGSTVLTSNAPLAIWSMASSVPGDVYSASAMSATRILFGGDFGVSLFDGTSSWAPDDPKMASEVVSALWVVSGSVGYAAIDNTTADSLRQRELNGTWGTTLTMDGNMNAVWGVSGEIFVGGDSGKLYHRHNGMWQEETNAAWGDINGLWAADADDVWLVADNGIARSHSDGKWQDVTPMTNNGLQAVWGSNEKDVYVVGKGGTILHFH